MFRSMREVNLIMPPEYCYYRSRLSREEQDVYDQLCAGVAARETTVRLRGGLPERLSEVAQAVSLDQPMLFYFRGQLTGRGTRFSASLELTYTMPLDQIDPVIDRMERRLRTLLPSGGTEVEREEQIHNRMQEMGLKIGDSNAASNPLYMRTYSVVGPLLDGRTVCEGAAHLFTLLCGMSGLHCIHVSGDAFDQGRTGGHAWNLVRLGGSWVHVDAYWDLLTRNARGQGREYNYFNLSDARIGVDHFWDRGALPACTTDQYSYFARNGCECPTLEAFMAYARQAVGKGHRRIYARLGFQADPAELAAMVSAIPSWPRVKRWSYTPIDRVNTVSIFLWREGDPD